MILIEEYIKEVQYCAFERNKKLKEKFSIYHFTTASRSRGTLFYTQTVRLFVENLTVVLIAFCIVSLS